MWNVPKIIFGKLTERDEDCRISESAGLLLAPLSVTRNRDYRYFHLIAREEHN